MNIVIYQLEIIRPADQEVLYQLFFLTEKRAMKWIKKNKEKFAKYKLELAFRRSVFVVWKDTRHL